MHDDSGNTPPANLDTGLNVAAIVAFAAALVAGGTLALPLSLLGGACLGGSLIAHLTRAPEGECWPRSDENEPPDAGPTVSDTGQALTPQPRRWVETVTNAQRPSRTR